MSNSKSRIGLSSACFYPMETLESIKTVCSLDFHKIEVFFNSFSELEIPFLKEIKEVCTANSTTVISVHPFTSGFEHNMFFSEYKRRVQDSIEFYRKYFFAASYLGAKYVVFHGDKRDAPFLGMQNYCEVISKLIVTALEYGIIFTHENVVRSRASQIDFIRDMIYNLGAGNIKFTFDLKQAIYSKVDIPLIIKTMGQDIVNVHLNDFDGKECKLPFEGKEDIVSVFNLLKQQKYDGDFIIEVYKNNYNSYNEIVKSRIKCNSFFLE